MRQVERGRGCCLTLGRKAGKGENTFIILMANDSTDQLQFNESRNDIPWNDPSPCSPLPFLFRWLTDWVLTERVESQPDPFLSHLTGCYAVGHGQTGLTSCGSFNRRCLGAQTASLALLLQPAELPSGIRDLQLPATGQHLLAHSPSHFLWFRVCLWAYLACHAL